MKKWKCQILYLAVLIYAHTAEIYHQKLITLSHYLNILTEKGLDLTIREELELILAVTVIQFFRISIFQVSLRG